MAKNHQNLIKIENFFEKNIFGPGRKLIAKEWKPKTFFSKNRSRGTSRDLGIPRDLRDSLVWRGEGDGLCVRHNKNKHGFLPGNDFHQWPTLTEMRCCVVNTTDELKLKAQNLH